MRGHSFVRWAVPVMAIGFMSCPSPTTPPNTTLGAENCTNHIDDNGDGKIDCLDPKCIETSACVFGEICDNGHDDNNNTLVDCADPQCEGQACGSNCLCVGGAKQIFDGSKDGGRITPVDAGTTPRDAGQPPIVIDAGMPPVVDAGPATCTNCGAGCSCSGTTKSETACGDGSDNDGDGQTDCADSDCLSQSCGAGCQCGAGGTKLETNCGDSIDNNGVGGVDCNDPTCLGQSCGAGCVCQANHKQETNCSDGLDNNGLGGTDCADADCAGQSCGNGCQCAASVKKEVNCSDGVDNDGDGNADCADADCVGAGTEICDDGIDNTCDRAIDCGDSKCASSSKCSNVADGKACTTDSQCAGGKCYSELGDGLPNGSCSNASSCTVSTNAGCHGGTCTPLSDGSFNVCRIHCTGSGTGTSGACRLGYACIDPDVVKGDTNNNNFCIALCTKDSECSGGGSGYGCNLSSKRCESTTSTKLPYGAACTAGTDCAGGYCTIDANHLNGYCTGPCRNDLKSCDPSGLGGYCNVDPAATDNVSLCLRSCGNFNDCRINDRMGCWQLTPEQTAAACQCLPAGRSFAARPTYGGTCCNGAPSSGTVCP